MEHLIDPIMFASGFFFGFTMGGLGLYLTLLILADNDDDDDDDLYR